LTAVPSPAAEFRGFWADVWGEGVKSTAQIDAMITRALAGRYNAIVAQVLAYQDNASGGHGAYWNSAIVPKAPDIVGGIDPLAYLVQQAHANGLEVHAWLVAYRASTAWPPAGNPTLQAHPEWLMTTQAGMGGGPQAFSGEYFLDPGSPDVQQYLISIVQELVTNYAIDGIHWDRIRHVQADSGYPTNTSYANSGLARFQRITGYSGTPSSSYGPWSDFRRRCVTELVRRTRAEIAAIPSVSQPVRHSASVITWGGAPSNFTGSSAYTLFQNWEEWQRLGYLDMTVPMTYYDQDVYPSYYTGWVNKQMQWAYDRHMVVGVGIYLNSFANSKTQMLYARNAGADGLCTYSYRSTNDTGANAWDWYPYVASNVFTTTDTVPTMPWRYAATATEGTLWGMVTDATTGEPIDDATVQISGFTPVQTDGNGYYTMTLLPASGAGAIYSVTASAPGYDSATDSATVVAGGLGVANFALSHTTSPIFIVESRPGGQNYANFSSAGTWAVSSSKGTAEGCTPGIGSLYSGLGYAGRTTTYSFTPTVTSTYKVYATWITSSNACSSARHVITHAGGTSTVYANQLTGGDEWNLLGSYQLNAGTTYSVTQFSEGSSGGSVIRAEAIKWERVDTVPAPTITQHPTAESLCPGGMAGFMVTATGDGTLTYQWQKNGANITDGQHYAGATTASLTVLNVGSSQVGDYRCVVTNAGGSTNSNTAALTLKQATTITQQPTNQSTPGGGTATFTVVATSEGTPTYQWQKNGTNLTNGGHYSGVTTATLTISNADSNDEASYRCVVTGGCGSATSNAATLTVTSASYTYIVESRPGGQNYNRYSETGTWNTSVAKSTAAGCTAGIGSRWCELNSSPKTAVFRFTPPTTGTYRVYTTNGTTNNAGNPQIFKITHAGGTATVGVCQNTSCSSNSVNKWYLLGTYTLNRNTQYTVTVDGSTGSGSGPALNVGRADAIKWER